MVERVNQLINQSINQSMGALRVNIYDALRAVINMPMKHSIIMSKTCLLKQCIGFLKLHNCYGQPQSLLHTK